MSRRNRDRRPARRTAFRDPKPRILVVCEGKLTEPNYFDGLRKAVKNPLVAVEIEPEAGVPLSVVRRAKELKVAAETAAKRERDENLKFDSVWAVFDVDDHPQLAEARTMAHENRMELAISNPCFELWLVLHFRDSPGMQHRDHIASLLRTFLPEYDKRVTFLSVAQGYNSAVTRARRLEETALEANDEGRNPSTRVWRLTELIRGDSTFC